ncbi:hypothetical protein ACQKP1_15785 [Allorhizobium sp. NPDC080224]|uniref:hypothetical protein n=1 Tax=Allorhizobium sp. NPDC080224 TaxID=3390547 RepID=UPI003D09583C
MLSALLAQFAPYLVGALALIGGIAAAYLKGRSRGSTDAKAKLAQADAKAVKTARKVEDDVRKSSDPDVDRRLSQWMRDKR